MARIIMMGPAGSGKGTQSVMISKQYNIPIISTGDLLRERIKMEDELGKKLNEEISKGLIVSLEIIMSILCSRLEMDDCQNGFILDGFPRTVEQAIELEKLLKQDNTAIDAVLVLDVPRDVVVKRISGRFECKNCKQIYNKFYNNTKVDGICDICGSNEFNVRKDDSNIAAINKRLDIYEEMSDKIIEYYNKKNLIFHVNALKSIEEISQDIKNILINNINKK